MVMAKKNHSNILNSVTECKKLAMRDRQVEKWDRVKEKPTEKNAFKPPVHLAFLSSRLLFVVNIYNKM